MPNVAFGTLVDPEEEAIKRKRALAEALRAESMAPMQTEVAPGGLAVPNKYGSLAKLVQALSGAYISKNTDEQQKAYGDRKRAEGAADVQGIVDALRGKAAIPSFQTGANEMGDEPVMQNAVPAQAPDTAKAMALALKSQNPMAQGIGTSLLSTMLPKTAKWEKFEKPNADGSKAVGFVDVNSPDPLSTFKTGGTAPVKQEFVNGAPVNPYTQTAAIPKQADAPNPRSDLLVDDGTGKLVPNKALVGVKKDIAKSGASNTSVNVSTEKGYAGEMAKGLAKQDLDALDTARSGPQRVQAAQQVKKILDTQAPITGTGAEARLAVTKALSTAGIIDGQGVKSTEDLASLLANQTLEAIKTSGLGSGQGFTDKDRAFLERAKSGNIEINAGTLRTLADLNEKSARESIKRGQAVAKRLQGNKDFGSVGQDLDIAAPPEYAPPSVVRKPPAAGGTLRYNPATGGFE